MPAVHVSSHPMRPRTLRLAAMWRTVGLVLLAGLWCTVTTTTGTSPLGSEQPTVRLVGCVVDRNLHPIGNLPVRFASTRGKVLATTVTHGSGEFDLRVTPQVAYSVNFNRGLPTRRLLRADRQDVWMDHCLQEN